LNYPQGFIDPFTHRLGYFDPPASQPFRQLSWTDVNTADAQALAHRAAVEGMVLLKNDDFLPIQSDTKKVALIGPYVNATTDMQGNYFGTPPFFVTPFQGAVGAGFEVQSASGTTVDGSSSAGFDEAIGIAQAADVVIFAGGIDNSIERESKDRTTVIWTGNQLELIKQLSSVGKPLVVVQFGGGQLDDTELLSNEVVRWLFLKNTALADNSVGSGDHLGWVPRTKWGHSHF